MLSGGYEDDYYRGDVIIYTGEGGRDRNGTHIKDQTLTKGNMALVRSYQLGLPVRVIRGAGHKSTWSPNAGYRYAGCYYIDQHWHEKGRSGYKVYRFRLIKDSSEQILSSYRDPMPLGNDRPPRTRISTLRIVRDTEVTRFVKKLYDFRCQICGTRLETNAGPYAEGAHIRPLGGPHNGPDRTTNVLCLCLNHHVLFDAGGFSIDDDYTLLGLAGHLTVNNTHNIDSVHLAYHRERFYLNT